MENSKISWTNHTFNPWIGCNEVSSGCRFCYARYLMQDRLKKATWGKDEKRILTSQKNWDSPLKWQKQAAKNGIRVKVFSASLADIFDESVRDDWRNRFFDLVYRTQNIDWLILTKRPENIFKYFSKISNLPGKDEWKTTETFTHELGNYQKELANITRVLNHFPNIVLGTSICNLNEESKIAQLTFIKNQSARNHKIFISLEPLLGDLNFYDFQMRYVDWIIVGGESGLHKNVRPMKLEWVMNLLQLSRKHNIPFFFKQWGEWVPESQLDLSNPEVKKKILTSDIGYFGGNTFHQGKYRNDRFPEENECYYRIGTKLSGNTLNGKTIMEFPEGL